MTEVFAKARELGEALLRSDEYATMKAVEERAMRNERAATTMSAYLEHRRILEEIMASESPDVAAMSEHSTIMEGLQREMKEIDDVVELTNARAGFSNLIAQVNQVLKFIVTGEMDQPEEENCGGSCASCGRCHTLH